MELARNIGYEVSNCIKLLDSSFKYEFASNVTRTMQQNNIFMQVLFGLVGNLMDESV
jgi:hypothetical protein